jgi:serine/threonine-protein kinase
LYRVGLFGRRPFLVLEYVPGRSLASVLEGGPVGNWRDAVAVAAQVAAAVAAAHGCGLVHRDVKPDNVMLAGPMIKVIDFGLAAGIGRLPAQPVGPASGTVTHMAPEQLRGEAAHPANDMYALGVLLYQMLTGHLPWRRGSGVATDPARALTLPDMLVDLCDRCLSRTAAHRPTSEEAVQILNRLALPRFPALAGAATAGRERHAAG